MRRPSVTDGALRRAFAGVAEEAIKAGGKRLRRALKAKLARNVVIDAAVRGVADVLFDRLEKFLPAVIRRVRVGRLHGPGGFSPPP